MFKTGKKKMQQWNELATEANRVDLYRKVDVDVKADHIILKKVLPLIKDNKD
jgi:hypothetical protein